MSLPGGDFRKLWSGQAISQLGSSVSGQALPMAAILVLGASPVQMGLLGGAGAAGILMFGLFAGAWADRVRRRPILIFADVARALVLVTIPAAAFFHRLTMAHLYAAAACGGVLTVLFDAAYQAYVPGLVEREHLLEANGKLALTESIAEVAGPGLGGVLVQTITAPMAILVDAASFLCSAFSIARIGKPEAPPRATEDRRMRREIGEGLRAAWSDPMLRALALRTGTGSVFLGVIGSLYFVFAMRELGLNAAVLGVIISLGGASNLLGALISARLVRRFGFGRVLIGSALTCGFAALIPPLARGPAWMCAAILTLGQVFDMTWPIYHINELSLRQSLVPDGLLGRVNSAMRLLFYGMMAVGSLAGGYAAQAIGMRAAMLAAGLGFLLSNGWLMASPIGKLKTITAVSGH